MRGGGVAETRADLVPGLRCGEGSWWRGVWGCVNPVMSWRVGVGVSVSVLLMCVTGGWELGICAGLDWTVVMDGLD